MAWQSREIRLGRIDKPIFTDPAREKAERIAGQHALKAFIVQAKNARRARTQDQQDPS